MSKHDHPEPKPPCSHIYGYDSDKDGQSALTFCARCDAVECVLCQKEWKVAFSSADGFWRELQRQNEKDKEENLYPQRYIIPKPKAWLGGEVLCAHGGLVGGQ